MWFLPGQRLQIQSRSNHERVLRLIFGFGLLEIQVVSYQWIAPMELDEWVEGWTVSREEHGEHNLPFFGIVDGKQKSGVKTSWGW